MTDLYSAELASQLLKNRKEVVLLLDKRDQSLMNKIGNFAEKFGMEEEHVIQNIKKGDVFAINHFIKDPKKQNICEQIAAEYIKEISGIKDFKKVYQKRYISSGALIDKKDIRREFRIKSIDFSFRYNGKQIYAAHKYTGESGGTQGRQYIGLQNFVKEANYNKDSDTFFVLIVAGDYYTKKSKKTNKSRLDTLKGTCTPCVKACTIEELEEELKKL